SDPRFSAEAVDLLSLFFDFCFHAPPSNAPQTQSQRPSSTAFRALSARATFLCLCKETWRKETHPASAPGAARRVRGAGGIFRRGILPLRKTPHIPVRRPCGVLSAGSAATEGPRRSKAQVKINSNSNSNSNSNGNGNGNGKSAHHHAQWHGDEQPMPGEDAGLSRSSRKRRMFRSHLASLSLAVALALSSPL